MRTNTLCANLLRRRWTYDLSTPRSCLSSVACIGVSSLVQKLVEDLEDASNEIMLSDDDVVKYTVGECFVHMDGDAAEERLTTEAGRAASELDTLKKELDEINEEMASLKKLLYAKFKDQINLEDS